MKIRYRFNFFLSKPCQTYSRTYILYGTVDVIKSPESLQNGQFARFLVTFSLKLKYFLLLHPSVPAERDYRGPRSFTVVFFGFNPPPPSPPSYHSTFLLTSIPFSSVFFVQSAYADGLSYTGSPGWESIPGLLKRFTYTLQDLIT